MARYMTFVWWWIAFSAGAYVGGVDRVTFWYGLMMLAAGCIMTNWCYGTRNETGLPYFNPPEEK